MFYLGWYPIHQKHTFVAFSGYKIVAYANESRKERVEFFESLSHVQKVFEITTCFHSLTHSAMTFHKASFPQQESITERSW